MNNESRKYLDNLLDECIAFYKERHERLKLFKEAGIYVKDMVQLQKSNVSALTVQNMILNGENKIEIMKMASENK